MALSCCMVWVGGSPGVLHGGLMCNVQAGRWCGKRGTALATAAVVGPPPPHVAKDNPPPPGSPQEGQEKNFET